MPRCKWCGREYEFSRSTANNNKSLYCSGKCEAEAQKLEMENRKLRQETGGSGGDGCSPAMIKWGAIILIVFGLIGMCQGGDEEEEQDKKATQRIEQVTKTGKQEAQAVRKPAKKIEPMDESVQAEEMQQVVSEEMSVASSTNAEQAAAQQTSEEQVPEDLIEKQVDNQSEEVAEETSEHTSAEEAVFNVVEQMPEFPGGYVRLKKHLESHLQYPEVARENETQGRVIVQFVVNTDGSISDAQVARGLDSACDEEALRLINSMPHWIPGQQNGKNVRVKYTVPITFKL